MWAARPTLVTCKSLEVLCRPAVAPPPGPNMPQPQGQPGPLDLCPLERFLGCVFMSRQMHRFIQAEEMLMDLRTEDPSFKTECLQCRLIQNPYHYQTLHLKVAALPEYKEQLSMDEIQIIEKFFEMRVACPPFKPNNLLGLARILCTPLFVLRDFIQIMKFDLMPTLAQQANFKWTVQLCLRVPPSSAAPIVPTGQAGVLLFRNKILCFIQLTRICVGPGERASIVLPLVYDVAHRNTQVAEKREPGPALAVTAANIQLKRFAEYAATSHIGQESMLLLAVRDLLMNLNLPSDMSQVGLGGNGCHSPAGMMHSPLGMPMSGMGPMGPMAGMGHSMSHGMNMGPGPHGGMGMHVGHGPMGGMGPMGPMGPMMGSHSPGMGMGHGAGMGMGHGMPHAGPMSMMGPVGVGPMGNQMGSSMGGNMSMCGPMSGPMGSPMPHSGPMGSPMPGPMGSPMGGPGSMVSGPMGPMSGPNPMSGPGSMSGPTSMGSHMTVPMGPASHIGQHPMMGP